MHKDEHVHFLFSTGLVDSRPLDLNPAGYLDFIAPELPLSAGEYSLVLWIECKRIVQDSIIGVAQLTVIDGDFCGTGRNYPPGWAGRCVLAKHHWRNDETFPATAIHG